MTEEPDDLAERLSSLYGGAMHVRVGHVQLNRRVPGMRRVGALTAAIAIVVGLAVLQGLPPREPGQSATTPTPNVPAAAASTASPTIVVAASPDGLRPCILAAVGEVLFGAFERSLGAGCDPYLSQDDGKSWRALSFGTEPTAIPQQLRESITAVAVGARGTPLLVGTSNGRILRADLGNPTLSTVYRAPGGTFQPIVGGFAFDADRAFATVRGVLRSDDDGRTWQDISVGLGSLSSDPRARPRFGTAGPIIIGAEVVVGVGGNTPGLTGVWASNDLGTSWSRYGTGTLGAPATGERGLASFGTTLLVAGPGLGWTDADGRPIPRVSLTSDHGRTWQAADRGLAIDVDSLAVSNGRAIAGTATGPQIYADGVWRLIATAQDFRLLTATTTTVWGAAGGQLVRVALQ